MSGVNTLRISSDTAPSLASTQVIPVLSGAPTLSGFHPETGPSAALVTLADLGTYLGDFAGFSGFPALAPNGTSGAPSYSFENSTTSGMYYDGIFLGVISSSVKVSTTDGDVNVEAGGTVSITAVYEVLVGSNSDGAATTTLRGRDTQALGFGVAVVSNDDVEIFAGDQIRIYANSTVQIGDPTAARQTIFAGTGYGAGVASVRFNGLTTAAVADQTGTLLNAPVAGNPTFWMPVSIAGVIKYLPLW